MGLLAARLQTDRPDRGMGFYLFLFLVSLIAVIALSLSFSTWLWVPAFIVLLHVGCVKLLPQWCLKAFAWVGGVSAAIFVCHPITRKIFIPISRHGDLLDGLAIYIVTTIVLAMIFNSIIKTISHR